ncbi:unnamed protein product [Moneuplotes crassus]|uniref:Uncharacterized protein n=1 Tax=Euplotes crassus TaxID=5936 RepID=A0AAD1X7X8_EUPCR|nr:unnamed protein product [Moneuplotes crassus]
MEKRLRKSAASHKNISPQTRGPESEIQVRVQVHNEDRNLRDMVKNIKKRVRKGKQSKMFFSKSRMLRELCNSPLNLPPLEYNPDSFLKSPINKSGNFDTCNNSNMGKTSVGFKIDNTVSSDAKTRYRFGMFTPTPEVTRAVMQSNKKQSKRKIELDKSIKQLETKKTKLMEEIYSLHKRYERQLKLNKDLEASLLKQNTNSSDASPIRKSPKNRDMVGPDLSVYQSPKAKSRAKMSDTMLNFKKLRPNADLVRSQTRVQLANTYEDLLMSKDWRLKLVKAKNLIRKNKSTSRSNITPRSDNLRLSKFEIMEMYEKVKLERDDLKKRLDQVMADEYQIPKKSTEQRCKKEKSKTKVSKARPKTLMPNKKKMKIERSKTGYKRIEIEDVPISKVKHAMLELTEQIANLDTKEMNRFKIILDLINEQRAEVEFALARILGWNFFSEIQQLKETHKSQIFILNKQILGLKEKLMDMNSKVFKADFHISISSENKSSLNDDPVSGFHPIVTGRRSMTPRINITKNKSSKLLSIKSRFKPNCL